MSNRQPLPPRRTHGADSCAHASLMTATRSENKRARHDDNDVDINDEEIMLNVGGHRFKTTRNTLCKEPGCVLEAMFSGRHEKAARRNDDGSFFIDGDGTYFQHILNYLRVGAVVSLPPDEEGKEALAIEADFYGLTGLSRAIRLPKVDIYEHVSRETRYIKEEEDAMRKAFLDGSASAFDPYHGLVSLFSHGNGLAHKPLMYEPIKDRNSLLMDCLREEAPPGVPVVVNTIAEFQSNFNAEHPHVLDRLSDILLEESVIVAGGSVLQALTNSPGIRTASWWGENESDVDLFLYSSSPEEANRVASRIFVALAVDDESWHVNRSRGVITMVRRPPRPPFDELVDLDGEEEEEARTQIQVVQIVLRLYDSPGEVLLGFDCDSCCCAFDGKSVWALPRCLCALRTGVNILNPLHAWPNKPSYELRLAKYAYRGFAIYVPGLSKQHIDHGRIQRTNISEQKGLARLLTVAVHMETRPWQGGSFPRTPGQVPRLVQEMIRCSGGYEDHHRVFLPTPVDRIINTPEYRTSAWNEIVSAQHNVPEGVAPLLLDSWDTEKRSREYLNSEMDKNELYNVYYYHAYKQEV